MNEQSVSRAQQLMTNRNMLSNHGLPQFPASNPCQVVTGHVSFRQQAC